MSEACPGDRITLEVTSDTRNVARVRETVEQAASRYGFGENDVSGIALAVNEAVANVIKHGYGGKSGQPIRVTIEPVLRDGTGGIQIVISDRCEHVELDKIVGRDLDDVRPGGLGTHIIKTVMDEVEYTPIEPTGMEVRLLKLVPASEADSGGQGGNPTEEDDTDGQ